MEALAVQNNNKRVDVQRISSREVAEMMELRHTDLIRKIDKISKTLENAKMRFQKYWIESTYKVEGNNKTYKEYLISKEGCEFLAHKSTGEKGILFTHRYMERFAEMEKMIEQQALSVEQITEIAAKAAVAAITPLMDRFERLLTTKEGPKTESPKVKAKYTVTPIAKLFGLTGKKANEILAKNGVISKGNEGGWILNKKYEEEGWGITCYDGQYNNKPFVRYTEKGKQPVGKILSRANNQEQIKLF